MKVNEVFPMQSGGGGVRRGDIVWARVRFPHKWCPALVLASDDLGVQVSFSFSQNDAVSPTYFVESEVVPFEEAFPTLISRHNGDAPSLHSALRLSGQRVRSGLRCRCLTGRAQRALDGPAFSSEFDPAGVLGFVLDAAVSPWVETPRFAHAVRVVAQVHAFRSYYSMMHKKMYKETKRTGDNVKLLPCSSLGQKMHSITQESVALEPKEKCQIISKNGEENIAIGAIRRLSSTVSVWEGNSEHLFKNKPVIISENLMHSPALEPPYMVQESLKPERQNLLGFKKISDQGIVDNCFGNCSTMGKTHISVPSNFKTHLSNYVNKRKDNALGLYCRLPDIETIIYLNRKRRQLDKPASCLVFPQVGGVQESESNAYISKHTRPRISHIKMLEPEGSVQKDHQASTCFCETTMNSTDEVQKVDLKRSQHCKSLSNLVLRFQSDKCEVDASAAKVKGTLGSDSSVYQERLQMSCNSDTGHLKLKRSARTELSSGDCLVEGKYCYQSVASCSIFNSKVGQLSKTQVPFSPISLHMRFPKNFNLPSKEQLIKKFSVFGSVDSCRTRVFCFTGSAQVAFLREADAVAAYQYAKKKVLFGDANVRIWLDPFEHNRRGFKCSAHVPPSASKQIGRRGFMCSAHVPPSTNKQIGRRGFNCSAHVPLSASKQIGPPLKSCLKNSNSLRQENRKKRCRVRFTIET